MALRAGTRTVIKAVTDKYDDKKDLLIQNSSLRRIYKTREITSIAAREAAEEDCNFLDTLMFASKHRLDMLKLQLEEAEIDNNADRIRESTEMLETAVREHESLETKYIAVTHARDRADARAKEAYTKYRATVEEFYQLNTAQDYLAQCEDFNNLSKTVADKRRDNELANEFNSSVAMR